MHVNSFNEYCGLIYNLKMTEKAMADNKPNGGKTTNLLREITFLHTTCIMTGTIIGSGIFVSPVSIVSHCQSVGLSLLVWLLAGVIVIFVALSYAELACLYPKAGGEYEFYKILLPGDVAAFLLTWIRFIICAPVFHAILAMTTSQYLFKPLFRDCSLPLDGVKIFSIFVLGRFQSRHLLLIYIILFPSRVELKSIVCICFMLISEDFV